MPRRWRIFATSPGDGRNDADLIAFLDRSGQFIEEADVVLIEVDIHETANGALLVEDALTEAGIGCLKALEDFGNSCALRLDDFVFAGQLAQGCGNTDLDWHGSKES